MNRFTLLTLPENFRSAKAICRAASKLIAHNPDAKFTEIIPTREEEGTVAVRVFENERAEEKFILNHVADLLHEADPKPTIAILCRTNVDVIRLSDCLMNEGFRVGLKKTPNLPDGWDSLKATLSFFDNPFSDFHAHRFLKTIWTQKQADDALARARYNKRSLNEEALNFPTNPATDPISIKHFMDSRSAVPLGTIDFLCERLKEAPSGLSMADILIMLNEYEESGANEHGGNHDVEVLTIHSAKAREWNHTVLSGWSEGFFPRGQDDIQSERRVAYVALTRARDTVLITCPMSRWTKWNGIISCEKSRFANEIL